MRKSQPYHNIQGRRAGKATRDLHYRREVFKHKQIVFGLTNAERNLYKKVYGEVSMNRPKAKKQNTNRIMKVLLFLRRFFKL